MMKAKTTKTSMRVKISEMNARTVWEMFDTVS